MTWYLRVNHLISLHKTEPVSRKTFMVWAALELYELRPLNEASRKRLCVCVCVFHPLWLLFSYSHPLLSPSLSYLLLSNSFSCLSRSLSYFPYSLGLSLTSRTLSISLSSLTILSPIVSLVSLSRCLSFSPSRCLSFSLALAPFSPSLLAFTLFSLPCNLRICPSPSR